MRSEPTSRSSPSAVDDETYAELVRLAANGAVEPGQFAARILTAGITRARFGEAAKDFAAEHAAGFANRFGTGPDRRAAT